MDIIKHKTQSNNNKIKENGMYMSMNVSYTELNLLIAN